LGGGNDSLNEKDFQMTTLETISAAVTQYLSAEGTPQEKGDRLERLFHEILKEIDAKDIFRYTPGFQFGRDFFFRYNEHSWFAECKNLSSRVDLSDVADKILCFGRGDHPEFYAVVSPTPPANNLHNFFVRNPFSMTFVNWTGDDFFYLCASAPRTMAKFCNLNDIESSPAEQEAVRSLLKGERAMFPPSSPVSVRLLHQVSGGPHLWSYFLRQEGVSKAFPHGYWHFELVFANRKDSEIQVDHLECIVTRVADLPKRVLGIYKVKGITKKPRVILDISTAPNRYENLLEQVQHDGYLRLNPNGLEPILVDLVGAPPDGVYKLDFKARCMTHESEYELRN